MLAFFSAYLELRVHLRYGMDPLRNPTVTSVPLHEVLAHNYLWLILHSSHHYSLPVPNVLHS